MLRFQIDGDWEPEDFIDLFEAIESLYYKASEQPRRYWWRDAFWMEGRGYFSYDDRIDAANRFLMDQARRSVSGHHRMGVRRVEYASPGNIDFLGIGEAFKSIEGIVDRLITFFTERNLRRERDQQARSDSQIKEIQVEKERESLRSLQIENARELLKLKREYPDELEEFLLPLAVRDQEKISRLIAEGKLLGVERSDGEEEA